MGVVVRKRKDKDATDYWIFISVQTKRRCYKVGSKSEADAIASELRTNLFWKKFIEEKFELMEELLKQNLQKQRLIKRIEYLESQIEKIDRRKGPRKLPMVVFGD